MAERANGHAVKAKAKPKAKAAASNPAAPGDGIVRGDGDRMPSEYLRRRSAMFQSMTQGAGKPMCYPSLTSRSK